MKSHWQPTDTHSRPGRIHRRDRQLFAILATPFLVPTRLPMGAYFGIAMLALLLVALCSVLVLRRCPLQWSQTSAES